MDAQCFNVSQAQLATFPRLAALSFRNIIWGYNTWRQIDVFPFDFIVRHQKTLRKLELRNCRICIMTPPHYWADIYKWLATALAELVELEVEFQPCASFDGYSYYDCLEEDKL